MTESLNPIVPDNCGARSLINLEFWESEHTRPNFIHPINKANEYFQKQGQEYLASCMEHPYLPVSKIKQYQFDSIKALVELAYQHIPVYRDKYKAAGFSPADLKSFDDIQNIPVITKSELIKAFPKGCLNPHFPMESLFPTRSSGSSGQTLLIRVDEEAILKDTIQGVRQFAMQSGLTYRPEYLVAHIYTVPWWYNSMAGKYLSAFISNIIPPARASVHLREIAPQILSCYPSNLEALLPYAEAFKDGLYLTVTHSEYSSRTARNTWSSQLGCPVLDEYSSEEATRIALEMPCGHYHTCEDSVLLESLNPETLKLETKGKSGIAVITNLLNTAMPFIRYVQGDFVTMADNNEPCNINWSSIASIDGRINDAFINQYGRKIPSGSLLDITYRWMFDRDLHLEHFELVQKSTDLITGKFVLGDATTAKHVQDAVSHLEDLLSMCLEHPISVKADVVAAIPSHTQKRRPIRCEVKV